MGGNNLSGNRKHVNYFILGGTELITMITKYQGKKKKINVFH